MVATVIYGFTAGAVATVNPCGFALLPVWFAREIADHADRPPAVRFVRSAVAGLTVSLGFVAIFAVAGLVFASGAAWLGPALQWVGVVLGLALAVIGAAWLAGLRLPGGRLAATCRRANLKYGAFGFGLSYGLVSISCTLPVFTAVAGMSFLTEERLSPFGFLAFLGGAASVFVLVAVAGVSSGTALSRFVAARARTLRRLAGGLTLLAGLYITLYWGRLFFAETPLADEIAYSVGAWASRAATMLSSGAGVVLLFLGSLAVVGLAWIMAASMSVRRPRSHRSGD